jgi:chemotaxis protein methyltransferase CheR
VAALTAWIGNTGGPATEDLEIELLLEALFQQFGADFRGYDRPALRRKLQALMRTRALHTVSSLQERVLHEPGAASKLLRALAPAPSGLFDYPELARQLRIVLAASLRASAVPKVWLAECAGIGDAWSVAILLAEEQLHTRTEIYATMANEELLGEVRNASFPAERLAEFQETYQRSGGSGNVADYFDVSDGAATLLPHLRSRITWAQYSLVTDASFNEFEAIICRRALPDFGPLLRQRVLRLFHDSLARFGILGIDRELSPADALTASYQPVFPRLPWYKRIA